jgi:hypothetical protein
LTTTAAGAPDQAAVVGFGSSGVIASFSLSPSVDIWNGATGSPINQAFVLPRNGTIRDIRVRLTGTTVSVFPGNTLRVTIQLYTAPSGSYSFVPLAGTQLTQDFPTLSLPGQVSGVNLSGAVPVTAGDSLLMVVSSSIVAGPPSVLSTGFFVSGGITIE